MELSYIISKAKCVISNDSSPIHIASAFNIPTLAIFGATIPDFGYTPLSDKAYISEIHLDCRPCGIHGGRICPKKHFKCMIEQDIGLMFDNILKLIK
jgi:heptosyltransferase-2